MKYETVPNPLLTDDLWHWIEQGRLPGGFLAALLQNDLASAVARADGTNVRLLPELVQWLYGEAPAGCWGSKMNVRRWRAQGGLGTTEQHPWEEAYGVVRKLTPEGLARVKESC